MNLIVWIMLITNWATPVELAAYQSEATCMAASKQAYTYTRQSAQPTVYTMCVPVLQDGMVK